MKICVYVPLWKFPAEPKRRIPHHQDLGQESRYEKSFKTAMRLKEEQDLEDYFKEASTDVDITSAFSTSVEVAKKDEVVAEPDLTPEENNQLNIAEQERLSELFQLMQESNDTQDENDELAENLGLQERSSASEVELRQERIIARKAAQIATLIDNGAKQEVSFTFEEHPEPKNNSSLLGLEDAKDEGDFEQMEAARRVQRNRELRAEKTKELERRSRQRRYQEERGLSMNVEPAMPRMEPRGACANPEPTLASRVLPNGTIVEWLERGKEEDEKLRMLNKGPNGEVLSKEPRGRNYREERESMRKWAEIARAHEVPAFPNRPYRPPRLRYRIPEGRFPISQRFGTRCAFRDKRPQFPDERAIRLRKNRVYEVSPPHIAVAKRRDYISCRNDDLRPFFQDLEQRRAEAIRMYDKTQMRAVADARRAERENGYQLPDDRGPAINMAEEPKYEVRGVQMVCEVPDFVLRGDEEEYREVRDIKFIAFDFDQLERMELAVRRYDENERMLQDWRRTRGNHLFLHERLMYDQEEQEWARRQAIRNKRRGLNMVLNNPHLGEPNDRCIPVLPIYRTPVNLPTEQLNSGRQVAKQGVQGSRRNDQGQEEGFDSIR